MVAAVDRMAIRQMALRLLLQPGSKLLGLGIFCVSIWLYIYLGLALLTSPPTDYLPQQLANLSRFVTSKLPTVYIITPTHKRHSQHPDMTRLAQTLMAAGPGQHWLVVEDALTTSDWVRHLVKRTLPHAHTLLHCKRNISAYDTEYFENLAEQAGIPRARGFNKAANGVVQRNCALQWLLDQNITEGVILFGDDDNSIDVRLFNEIRSTAKVSVFPTGHFSGMGVSTVVVRDGNVVGFIDQWDGHRKWPVDMASFAVNVGFWRARGAPLMVDIRGYIEDCFFKDMSITVSDLEAKADNCTKIYVWHTQTVKMGTRRMEFERLKKRYPNSNVEVLGVEVDPIWNQSVIIVNSTNNDKMPVHNNRQMPSEIVDEAGNVIWRNPNVNRTASEKPIVAHIKTAQNKTLQTDNRPGQPAMMGYHGDNADKDKNNNVDTNQNSAVKEKRAKKKKVAKAKTKKKKVPTATLR